LKGIFLVLIKLYWKTYPEEERRVCLYKETCSKHTERMLLEKGFFVGITAFFKRMRNCKGGYSYQKSEGKIIINTFNNAIITEEEINPFVLAGLKAALS
jgi:putative component of membrane protein insertase Oxa1/YidC/SpoIIIJ protein YidD